MVGAMQAPAAQSSKPTLDELLERTAVYTQGAIVALSNVVSNVPAVMLLLRVATLPFAGPLLALVSTLAGNLFIVGSVANIIVVDAAERQGVRIDWRVHARVGVPVALVTLAITAVYLALRFGGAGPA